MANDTLHTVTEVFNAIQQLKLDLKPEPKSEIEKYGVIIGASIAVGGSILTLILTISKEYFFSWKISSKEKNEFRRKIYGELSQLIENVTHQLIDMNRLYSRMTYYNAKFILLDKDERSKVYEEKIHEINKELFDVRRSYKKEFSEFKAKANEYVFFKTKNTKVIKALEELSNIPNYLINEKGYAELKDEDSIKKLHETHIRIYKNKLAFTGFL